MPMKTELPDEPAGQVPIGGWSAAKARAENPIGSAKPAGDAEARAHERAAGGIEERFVSFVIHRFLLR